MLSFNISQDRADLLQSGSLNKLIVSTKTGHSPCSIGDTVIFYSFNNNKHSKLISHVECAGVLPILIKGDSVTIPGFEHILQGSTEAVQALLYAMGFTSAKEMKESLFEQYGRDGLFWVISWK